MKLSEFYAWHKDKERDLAYGSETCIREAFVNDFGYESDIDPGIDVNQDLVDAYHRAYRLHAVYTTLDIDFNVSDLF